MAKRYTSTVQVRCWKEHTCACCGSVYSYILTRKASGTGTTAAIAQANMQNHVARITQRETDMHPCPTCGLYQQDMLGQRRAKSRLFIFFIALIGLAFVFILRPLDGLQANTLTWIAAIVCGVAALAHLALEMHNSNSDLATNRNLAQGRLTEGKMRHVPGQANARPDPLARPPRSMLHQVTLILLVASVILVAAPELMRSAMRWPLNAECYPPVVGPADQTRVYMPQAIYSIKGFWRGDVTVALHYADDGGLQAQSDEIEAHTNQNAWSSTIYAETNEEAKTSRPWVSLTLPDLPDLRGKSVVCDIKLELEYPQKTGGTTFAVTSSNLEHTLTIHLASRGAGAQYNTLWWAGTAIGAFLVLGGSLVLYSQARAFQRQAKPTKVFAV